MTEHAEAYKPDAAEEALFERYPDLGKAMEDLRANAKNKPKMDQLFVEAEQHLAEARRILDGLKR
jgi:hypothetical protein